MSAEQLFDIFKISERNPLNIKKSCIRYECITLLQLIGTTNRDVDQSAENSRDNSACPKVESN